MPAAHSIDDAGPQPDGIHIVGAEGRVLRANLPTRKAGRALARELSRSGGPVYLVDPRFRRPVTPYLEGQQADDSPNETAPSDASRAPDALPELLAPGLDLVIVGINPGAKSARVGHYYSDPRNKFWQMLNESGLVDDGVGSQEDRDLPERFGIGLTDVVRDRVESNSAEVKPREIRGAAREFERRIAEHTPRRVCFNGAKPFTWVLRVLCPSFRRCPHSWGLQPVRIAGSEVWVMPSTSQRNGEQYHKETRRVLRELAESLGRSATR